MNSACFLIRLIMICSNLCAKMNFIVCIIILEAIYRCITTANFKVLVLTSCYIRVERMQSLCRRYHHSKLHSEFFHTESFDKLFTDSSFELKPSLIWANFSDANSVTRLGDFLNSLSHIFLQK